MDEAKRQLILSMLSRNPPAQVSSYDSYRLESMQKDFAHDPYRGDPVVTLGMDPYRVRHMTDPREKATNMGTYYSDEDALYVNPDLPRRDYTDTVKHEFRHRGTNMLDSQAGRPQDFNMEELVMLMTDMGNGIGAERDGYNLEAIRYLAGLLSAERRQPASQTVKQADRTARALNEEARNVLGGGGLYESPVNFLAAAMNEWRGPR